MKSGKLTLLVLGVGGNVGQGILKALECSSLDCRLLGACTTAAAFGLYAVERSFISPPANSPEFVEWLVKLCVEESVDAVLSGVEPVLDVLATYRRVIEERSGAVCLVNEAGAMRVGADKLRTCEWLREQGLPYPDFASSEDVAAVNALISRVGYPLVAKPRKGKGSQGIVVVKDSGDLPRLGTLANYVVEQYLGSEDEEYTAACLTDRNDILRGVIVFRRLLTSGTTSCAIAGHFPKIRDMATEVVKRLKPRGPCNVQMRLHGDTATCFEINVRFSGTTPIRARLGFNDVEAAVRHYVLDEPASFLPDIGSGVALRYWNEAYISTEAFAALSISGMLDAPRDFPFAIETFGNRG